MVCVHMRTMCLCTAACKEKDDVFVRMRVKGAAVKTPPVHKRLTEQLVTGDVSYFSLVFLSKSFADQKPLLMRSKHT